MVLVRTCSQDPPFLHPVDQRLINMCLNIPRDHRNVPPSPREKRKEGACRRDGAHGAALQNRNGQGYLTIREEALPLPLTPSPGPSNRRKKKMKKRMAMLPLSSSLNFPKYYSPRWVLVRPWFRHISPCS